MHSTNYTDTLIEPSEDGPDGARLPAKPGSVADMQYQRLAGAPYAMTSDELLVAVAAERKAIPEAELPAFRADWHARGQACLRASPLVKTHGWAIHYDGAGRIALIDPATGEHAALAADPKISRVKGMRSRRA